MGSSAGIVKECMGLCVCVFVCVCVCVCVCVQTQYHSLSTRALSAPGSRKEQCFVAEV